MGTCLVDWLPNWLLNEYFLQKKLLHKAASLKYPQGQVTWKCMVTSGIIRGINETNIQIEQHGNVWG